MGLDEFERLVMASPGAQERINVIIAEFEEAQKMTWNYRVVRTVSGDNAGLDEFLTTTLTAYRELYAQMLPNMEHIAELEAENERLREERDSAREEALQAGEQFVLEQQAKHRKVYISLAEAMTKQAERRAEQATAQAARLREALEWAFPAGDGFTEAFDGLVERGLLVEVPADANYRAEWDTDTMYVWEWRAEL